MGSERMEDSPFKEQKKYGKLLSVKEVADLLNVSPRTVYDYSKVLGGFYPAGIKVLRFNQEVICGYMEGQIPKGLVLQIPTLGEGIWKSGVQISEGRGFKPRKTKRGSQGKDQDDANRHGLFCGSKPVSG
jgi:hypothetical protein